MFIKTSNQTAIKLEQIFQNFLWGYNAEGGRKTALVSWDKLILPKVDGGLGLKDLQKHSTALLSRWVTQALDQPTTEWALLFCHNISSVQWHDSKHLRRAGYEIDDRILLGKVSAFGVFTYTSGLWQAWTMLRFYLILSPSEAELPARWRVADVLDATADFGNLPKTTKR
jgi:hypothetical protein